MIILLSCLISNIIFSVLGYKAGKAFTIIKIKDNQQVEIINSIEPSKEFIEESEEEASVPNEQIKKSFF